MNLGNDLVISGVGQADDTALLANDIYKLRNILHLVLDYCTKFNVTLSPGKTKLMQIGGNHTDVIFNPLKIDNTEIKFVTEAEHVGVLRSIDGNLPNIMNRIISHKGALNAVLSCGLAQGRRANPTASLRVLQLYSAPVLLSGLASLVLSETELTHVDLHYKDTVLNLQKLIPRTPAPVVFFLAGSLSGKALPHLRQLALFSMLTRLPHDILNQRARYALTALKPSSKSWFTQVRDICLHYVLPHPLSLLDNPPQKETFKKLAKSRVIDYWEKKLRAESSSLDSLQFFKPDFMSLTKPHQLWLSAGSNPYEVSKAVIQARFLSARYRSEEICRHWSSNVNGFCQTGSCTNTVESIEHILITCPTNSVTRDRLKMLWLTSSDPVIRDIASKALSGPPKLLLQFLLDCIYQL